MPRVSDLLDRFRPAGAPGPAGAVGVPGDRRTGAELELAPVFASLEEVEHACAELREQAAAAARERISRAANEAERLIAQARRDAEAERAAAAARVRVPAEAELAQVYARAQAEAEQVRQRTAQRLPGVLDKVLAHIRTQLIALEQDDRRPVRPAGTEVPG